MASSTIEAMLLLSSTNGFANIFAYYAASPGSEAVSEGLIAAGRQRLSDDLRPFVCAASSSSARRCQVTVTGHRSSYSLAGPLLPQLLFFPQSSSRYVLINSTIALSSTVLPLCVIGSTKGACCPIESCQSMCRPVQPQLWQCSAQVCSQLRASADDGRSCFVLEAVLFAQSN